MPFLGGFRITSSRWVSPTGLRVDFSSTYTDRFYQLYAGRTLIGVTDSVDDRSVTGVLKPSFYPQEIQLVAVLDGEQLDDFGDSLPERPYNKVRLGFEVDFDEAEFIEITASSAPGEPVDPDNVLENILYDTDRAYAWVSPPLNGSGTWALEAAGIDLAGNRGDPLAFTAAGVLAIPPDVQLRGDGNRLKATFANDSLTLSFTYPRW